jgi:hypothetical protein
MQDTVTDYELISDAFANRFPDEHVGTKLTGKLHTFETIHI